MQPVILRICTLIMVCALAAAPSLASVPMLVSYQGRLTDAGGQPADGIYNMRFYLYDQETSGSLLWQDPASGDPARSVQVTGGLFNVLLGSVVPLPEGAFTGNTWLAMEVNGAPLTPRVRIVSVGYAIRARTAETVPDGAITTPKLADGAVTDLKVSDVAWGKLTGVPTDLLTGTGTDNYLSRWNGAAALESSVVYQTDTGMVGIGTTSPTAVLQASSSSTTDAVFGYTTGGTGSNAGYLQINNAANASPALSALTNGTGPAVYSYTTGGSGSNAGYFQIDNAANSSEALLAVTNGLGDAVRGYTTGSKGSAGAFNINNAANSSPALIGMTKGAGDAIYGSTAGAGDAVHGYTTGGTGSSAGYFEINSTLNGSPTLHAATNGLGDAVYGYTTGGSGSSAGYFQINNASNGSPAVYATTNGAGYAVRAYMTGAGGSAGYFNINNTANSSDALIVTTNGNGDAIYGGASGTGNAVRGYNSGAAANAGSFEIDNTANAAAALSARTSGTGYAGYFNGAAKGVYIYSPTGSAGLVVYGGNMGVGSSTTPANILTIKQYSSTDPIADAWTVYSSVRWKTNIEPISGALEKVKKLRGVSFDWKDGGKHDIGLIAEEVGRVVPEVVAWEEDARDAKSVDYARLVAVLIEAVKDQQKTIDELKARDVEITAELAELKARSAKD